MGTEKATNADPVNGIVVCGFSEAWVGKCENPRPCEKHAGLTCCVCGEPATHNCPETGQFVCGYPLCDDCEHTTLKDGTNGGIGFNAQPCPAGMKRHVRKSKTESYYTKMPLSCCPGCGDKSMIDAYQHFAVGVEYTCPKCGRTIEVVETGMAVLVRTKVPE